MLKKILPILFIMTMLLAACGPATLPTMTPADAQGTAVAATLTSIAATQAAIPTNTPVPPTETASPTPTLEPSASPTVTAAATNLDNCVKALNVGEAGPTKNVRIENENKSTVNLSLNLYKPNSFGQCGALSYTIKGGANLRIAIPSGSWSAYAWVLDPPSQPEPVSFFIGPSKTQDLLRLVIKQDVIAWVGP